MFTRIEDFTQDWKRESEGTARLMDALTDASLAQAVSRDDRTLGRVAWHIVATLPEMMGKVGIHPRAVGERAPVPATAKEIAQTYKAAAAEVAALVEQQWTDGTLLIVDDMYGQKWPRGVTLEVLLRHEIHHRGQMTVLMRQAGLVVPGIYGPAREGWAQMGMEPPPV